MKFRPFCIAAAFLFLGTASLFAQETSYEAYLHYQNMGYGDAYVVVDSWSASKELDGFIVDVQVVKYKDGSSRVSNPEKIKKANRDYMELACDLNGTSNEVRCDYVTYAYKGTTTEYEATFFDVTFYREIYKDVYEKKTSGFFTLKRI